MQIGKTGYIGTLFIVAVLSLSMAHAGKKNHAGNKNKVTQTVPVCPCFSESDIDSALADRNIVGCVDDRDTQGDERALTFIDAGSGGDTALIVTFDRGKTWVCSLEGNTNIGPYENIGLANAMACRRTIINSRTWARCP